MTRTRFEVVSAPPVSAAAAAPASGRGSVVTGMLVFALLGAATFLTHRQLTAFLSGLDEQVLGQATLALEHLLNRQRDQLAAEVTVLADDNRIRATVLAPKFDEATVQDVIEDIRKSSGATLLAVLDANGKVQVVSGTGALREANLGTSPAVKNAFTQAASDVWTLPDQVQVIGLAPIRSGEQTPALLVKGLPLGQSQLSTVEKTLGVAGAVFIGDRLAASSSKTPELDEAFRAASRLAEGTQPLSAGGHNYLVRVVRTGEAATAARVAWLVPYQHQLDRVRVLSFLVWAPLLPGALLLLLLIAHSRRTNGGSP